MIADFELLCTGTKEAAFIALEGWNEEPDEGVDVADVVLTNALAANLPSVDDIDGEWVMQMMWQVPDLMVDTEYSDGMDVKATTLKAVHFRIGNIIRDEVRERAGELGLDPGAMRI